MFIEITDKIKYIPSGETPLSSDVVFIRGNSSLWIYDVGANDEAFNAITEVIKNAGIANMTGEMNSSVGHTGIVNIVISHFHKDHMDNLERLKPFIEGNEKINVYVSPYTYKRSKIGTEVEEDIFFDGNMKMHIYSMPSSHAKGCLCLQIDDEIVFMGDSIFPQYRMLESDSNSDMGEASSYYESSNEYKKQYKAYNSQKLKEQIDMLNGSDVKKVFLSHEKRPVIRKLIIVKYLESIYSKRQKDNPFIYIGSGRCIF